MVVRIVSLQVLPDCREALTLPPWACARPSPTQQYAIALRLQMSAHENWCRRYFSHTNDSRILRCNRAWCVRKWLCTSLTIETNVKAFFLLLPQMLPTAFNRYDYREKNTRPAKSTLPSSIAKGCFSVPPFPSVLHAEGPKLHAMVFNAYHLRV